MGGRRHSAHLQVHTGREVAVSRIRMSTESLATASSRHPWRVVIVWVLVVAGMGFASQAFLADWITTDVDFTDRPESKRAMELIERNVTGEQVDTEFFVIRHTLLPTSDPAFEAYVHAVQDEVMELGDEVLAGPAVSVYEVLETAGMRSMRTSGPPGVLVSIQLRGALDQATRDRFREAVAQAVPADEAAGFDIQVVQPQELFTSGTLNPRLLRVDPPELVAFISSTSVGIDDPDPRGGLSFASVTEAVRGAIVAAGGDLLELPPVTYFDVASLISPGATLLAVPIVDTEIATVDRLREVQARVDVPDDQFETFLAGPATLNADTSKIAEEDLQRSELTGIGVALIVLIVVFGALVAALLPLAMAMVAIPIAFGGIALIAQSFGLHFSLFTTNIATMIGLAVGIDYSLFIIARYREERKKGFDPYGAITASGATASRAVFFSGLTVVLALMGMFIMPNTIFRSMAAGAMLVVLASIAASLTLLPALLGLFKDRVNWPRLSKRARMEGQHDPKGGFWDRLSKAVMARPVVFLVISVAILGSLSALYFTIDKGTTQSASTLPDEVDSKQAFIILSEQFGAGGRSEPVQVYVGGDLNEPGLQAAIREFEQVVAADLAFADQVGMIPNQQGTAAVINAVPVGDPFGHETTDAVQRLRNDVVPPIFEGTGAEVLVGGAPALMTDFFTQTDVYQPIVFAFVLGLSFLLLMVVFRSIVVPLKAVIMNLLSVGAAYGAIVLVFQEQSNGFLNAIHDFALDFFNLIGFQFQEVESIEAWLPLLLFSILFGLSMDYHVFLLSRIREEYDKTGDNTEAVAYGLRTTAGIITGAAIIMVAVFTAFAAGRLVPLQQMGFGLATAVFLDATIVRSILVPSSMKLLGDRNWYLPKWLEWLPKVNVEGREPPTEPVALPESKTVGTRADI
jgi:RND superfamily putative drug exporter